jgi:hypothetical protein
MHILTLILTGLVLAGCVTQPMVATDHKMDSDLRMAIARSEAAGTEATEEFSVFVRTVGRADREALTEAGLHVQTVAGDVATAVGTVEAIRHAAALDEVLYVSLSGTAYPQGATQTP